MLLDFEWDVEKARSNLRKHGVSFEEASTVFDDLLSYTMNDPEHSIEESRQVTFGHSDRDNLLVVCHCDRPSKIRIISARFATPAERRSFESGI
jgi:uncharacterized DUF497 family protein